MGCTESKPQPVRQKQNVRVEKKAPVEDKVVEVEDKVALTGENNLNDKNQSQKAQHEYVRKKYEYVDFVAEQCSQSIDELHNFTVAGNYKDAKLPTIEHLGKKIDLSEGNPNYINSQSVEKSGGLLTTQRALMCKIFGFNIMSNGKHVIDSCVAVRVRIDGCDCEIPAKHVVPGDVIHLKAGEEIPCDIRIIECSDDLKCFTATLTGEVDLFHCNADVGPEKLDSIRQRNVLLRSSDIKSGSAWGVVIASGMQTQIGYVFGMSDVAF